MVAEESTIGIGEIGLDYFHIDNKLHWQKQWDLLKKLVDFVHTCELPVIIHCHGSEVLGDEDVMQDCIQILASCLEKCCLVYVHCLNGNIQEHQMWLSSSTGLFPLASQANRNYKENECCTATLGE